MVDEVVAFPGPMAAHIDDPASLRLSQAFDGVPTERLLTAIKVGRPSSQEFFRVHPSEAYRGNFALITFGEDREQYAVAGRLQAELQSETKAVALYTTINRHGTVKLWPVGLPDRITGKDNEWFVTARTVASIGTASWVRLVRGESHWAALKAVADMGQPEWPDMPFNEMVQIAFRDRIIDRADHPVILKLQGLA